MGKTNIPSVSQSPFYSFHPINESPLCQVCIWWSRVYAWISDGLVPGLSKTSKINKYKNVNSFIIWLFFYQEKKKFDSQWAVFHNASCNRGSVRKPTPCITRGSLKHETSLVWAAEILYNFRTDLSIPLDIYSR